MLGADQFWKPPNAICHISTSETMRLQLVLAVLAVCTQLISQGVSSQPSDPLAIPDELAARADSSWFDIASKSDHHRNGVDIYHRYVAWHNATISTGRCKDMKIMVWVQPGQRGFADEHRNMYWAYIKAVQRQLLFFVDVPSWLSAFTPTWGWEWRSFLKRYHDVCGLPRKRKRALRDPRVISYVEGPDSSRITALRQYDLWAPTESQWRSLFLHPSPPVQALVSRNLALLGSPFVGVHIRTGAADSPNPQPTARDIPNFARRGFKLGDELRFLTHAQEAQSKLSALSQSTTQAPVVVPVSSPVRVFLATDLPMLITAFEQQLGKDVLVTTPGPVAHSKKPSSVEGLFKAFADWFTLTHADAAVITFNSFFGITAADGLRHHQSGAEPWRYVAIHLDEKHTGSGKQEL